VFVASRTRASKCKRDEAFGDPKEGMKALSICSIRAKNSYSGTEVNAKIACRN
jgi:hypothetical protein